MSVSALVARARRVKARSGKIPTVSTDRSPWEWYANRARAGCRPGNAASIHGRGRASDRLRVTGGSGGTSPAAGAGKTRAGASWIQQRVDNGTMKLGCLIAPTAADIRDVMVEGPSGLLNVAPPWNRPRFEPSKRRVNWPNGARAICLSGEEPERARGLNIDTLWADELACWQRAESTWDLVMLALRAGDESPGPDHDNPAPAGGAQTHPRRGDHGADHGHHLCQPGPLAAGVSLADRRLV